MMPTYSERQGLALQFSEAVGRMRQCLSMVGMQVDDDDIVYAWADYSDSLCAQWIALPESDQELLTILKNHLPEPRMVWQTVVEDAADGTGNVLIVLPNELLARLGWVVGDELESVTAQAGAVILRRRE